MSGKQWKSQNNCAKKDVARKCSLIIIFCSLFIPASLCGHSFCADTLTPNQIIGDGEVLASKAGSFELGFFSPGASKNRYLGIWYKNSPETIVWVANRNSPITDFGGVLTFGESGNLVILNRKKNVIWSSSVLEIVLDPVAHLLDTGNLVLMDSSKNTTSGSTNNYLWQSFEHPTDTLLPDMKIRWNLKTGQETCLTAWRSVDDPSPGELTYRLEMQGLPQLVVYSGPVKKYRTGPWKGFSFDGILQMKISLFKPIVVQNEEEVYYTYEPCNSTFIGRLTLNELGSVQRYVMNASSDRWNVVYWAPFDMCDNYGQCGVNSICRTSVTPPCTCLNGFVNTAQGNLDAISWIASTKCVRKMALDCQKGEGFVKIEGVKLPDMLQFSWSETMNTQECEAECLRNCSCAAYANLNISGRGKGCMMWFGDLIDVREHLGVGQDLYIRVPASELELLNGSRKMRKMRTLLAASLATVFGNFILGLIICLTRNKTKSKARKQGSKDNAEVPLFDFKTVAAATDSFSEANIVGAGGFGTVYKGKLLTGEDIAVKRLSKGSGQGVEEFGNELTLIAKLQHRNLVSILGSCIQGEERMLIYEYMPNKSLDYFLFDNRRTALLLWKDRLKIVLGIARGLLYLHQDSKLHVIHRDLKASNILLDSNLNPKISDFGLARIFDEDDKHARTERVIGTYGYMSPEYAIDGRFSVKSDVFSLGVILLEIVSGKRNRGFAHSDHYHSLLGHAWLLWEEGRALDLVDPSLEDAYVTSEVLRCIQVGLLCVQKLPPDRPDMSSVVFMLANERAILPQPKRPGFFTERSISVTNSRTRDEEQHSVNFLTITMPESR